MKGQDFRKCDNTSLLDQLVQLVAEISFKREEQQLAKSLAVFLQWLRTLNQTHGDHVDGLMIKTLNLLLESITNFKPQQQTTIKIIKEISLQTLDVYCRTFGNQQNIDVLEAITNFLNQLSQKSSFNSQHQSSNKTAPLETIFEGNNEGNIINEAKQSKAISEHQLIRGSFEWAITQANPNNIFYAQCVEVVLRRLGTLNMDVIQKLNINEIAQLVGLIYLIRAETIPGKKVQLAITLYEGIKLIVSTPTQQLLNQSIVQQLEIVSIKLCSMLNGFSVKQIQDQILVLTSQLAFNLIFHQSSKADFRIVGLRILESYAKKYYNYSPNQNTKNWAKFIVQQRLWSLLVNKNANIELIIHCEYLIKLFVNVYYKFDQKISQFYLSQFLKVLPSASPSLRKFYFNSIQPEKLTISMKSKVLQSFQKIHQNPEFYSMEFMDLISKLARQAFKSQSKKTIDILLSILQKHMDNFLEVTTIQKVTKTLKISFDKFFDSDLSQQEMVETYGNLLKHFLTRQNVLTGTICRTIFSKCSYTNNESFSKAVIKLTEQKGIIEKIINLISSQCSYKQEMRTLLKLIAKNVKSSQKLQVFQNVLLQCLGFKEIFCQLIKDISVQKCQLLFKKVYEALMDQQSQVKVEPFCIKELFYRSNSESIQKIANVYRISSDPSTLKFMRQIFNLLEKSTLIPIQQCCAEIIATVNNSFQPQYENQGKEKCKELMIQITNKLTSIKQLSQSTIRGLLYLTRQLMYATQTHGVGKIKAHNALITTSMVKVKIFNKITDFQFDTISCYEKSVPSNMTLFELLNKLAKKFNCGWHQIQLWYSDSSVFIPSQMNGHTLQELNFEQYHQLQAKKNRSFMVKHQPLTIGKQLNPLFINVLKQIFTQVSQQGKMGPKEIVKFIYKVTDLQANVDDQKVNIKVKQMILNYSSTENDELEQKDFIKFYEDSISTIKGQLTTRDNLKKAGYRMDFSKITQSITPLNEDCMFRYYLKNNSHFYQLLFRAIKQESGMIAQLAKQILTHLPTCEQLWQNLLKEGLNFSEKSMFEVNYIMVNVKYFLEKQMKRKNKQSTQIKNLQEVQADQNERNLEKQHRSNKNKKILNSQIGLLSHKMDIEIDHINNETNRAKYDKRNNSFLNNDDQSLFTVMQDESFMICEEVIQANCMSFAQRLIKDKNDLDIYELVLHLERQDQLTQEEELLKVTSIHILRALMNLPLLSDNQLSNENHPYAKITQIIDNLNELNLSQQQIMYFQTLVAQQCIMKGNLTLFEPFLGLCLYSQNLVWTEWLEAAISHPKKSIRKMTLHFLIFYSVKSCFSINFLLVDAKINPLRCQEWFMILYFFIIHTKQENPAQVLTLILRILSREKQEIGTDTYNPVMNGYLNLTQMMLSLHLDLVSHNIDYIFKFLTSILEKILSNANRMLLYQILYQVHPIKTLKLMLSLIKQVKSIERYEPKSTFVGIKNLGSTCYMNSILQQFFMIDSFKKIILNFPLCKVPAQTQVNGIQIVDDFLYQLQKMYTYLELSHQKSFYPKQFCLTLKDSEQKPINTSIQQDAHEFLNTLFSQIQKYCKKANKLKSLENIFQGKTVCQIVCSQCKNSLSKVEDFYHLSLEVKGTSQLMQSFKRFTAPQKMEDYKCDTCKKKSTNTKKTSILETPQILIINLQRIIFDKEAAKYVKVYNEQQFSQVINLNEMKHESARSKTESFRLKGVVIHSGTSGGGHYYSIIKIGQDWYKFDDENVCKVTFDDLKRLSFGGGFDNFVIDEMHSTNAYILFYELDKNSQKRQQSAETVADLEKQSSKQSGYNELSKEKSSMQEGELCVTDQFQEKISPISQHFKTQVIEQNKSFHHEIQIHQPSFFDFLNKLYHSQRPHELFASNMIPQFYQQWRHLSTLPLYQVLYPIYLEIIKFVIHCYKLSNNVFYETTVALCELISLLPEKTEDFLKYVVDQQKWIQVMCSHDDQRVREMYKYVMNKVVFVYGSYFVYNLQSIDAQHIQNQTKTQQSLSNQRLQQILTYFINATGSQIVSKNIYKSFYFFEFWKVSLEMDHRIVKFCLHSNFMFNLLDLLMGNESPFAEKDKKRQDIPSDTAVPLIQCVSKLIQFKRNLVGSVLLKGEGVTQQNCPSLTQQQGKILNSVGFYKRMMKFKYDSGQLPIILACMCYNDKTLSKQLSRLFLTCINDLNEVDNIQSLFNNISTFLRIQDQYQIYRLECILGVAQLHSSGKLYNEIASYGMGYSNESKVVKYFSAAWFVDDEKLKPLLELLYDKRSYETEFEANGIIALLEIIAPFSSILNYVLSLPPPIYLHQTYLTWISQYITKHFPTQEKQKHSNFQKTIPKMKQLYEIVQKKIDCLQKKHEIPVMKQIIGKNKNVEQIEEKSDQNGIYHLKVYVHETYIMDNLPQQDHENFSLPDGIFSPNGLKSYAYYFVEHNSIKQCEINIPAQKTIKTLFVQSKQPLLMKFALPHFTHQITVPKGENRINYGFTNEMMETYLTVQVLEQQQIHQQQKSNGFQKYGTENGYCNKMMSEDDYRQINCPSCTFLNDITAQKCEICQTFLY